MECEEGRACPNREGSAGECAGNVQHLAQGHYSWRCVLRFVYNKKVKTYSEIVFTLSMGKSVNKFDKTIGKLQENKMTGKLSTCSCNTIKL